MSLAQSSDHTHVLVIDDDLLVHQAFEKILKPYQAPRNLDAVFAEVFDEPSPDTSEQSPLQCELEHAHQGVEGLALAKQRLHEGNPFHVAIVDMRMPPGWDGVETIKRLWAVAEQLQIILCTAYSDYDWESLRRVLPRSDRLLLLKKPFDAIELMQMVETLGRKWHLSREAEARRLALEAALTERSVLLERASDFVYRCDEHGDVIYTSPAFERLTGQKPEFWWARRGDMASVDEPLAHPTLIDLQHAEGHTMRIELVERLVDVEAPEKGWIGVGRDVTERELLEARLRQSEKMETIGRLAGGLAHDFNNLLTVISGESELLDEQFGPGTSGYIGEATRQAVELTRRLLLFSRETPNEPELIAPGVFLTDSMRMFSRVLRENITIKLEVPEAPWLVRAPSADLGRVLMNLVVNASDAMREGGELRLAVTHLSAQKVEQSDQPKPTDRVCITVQDTGVGMDSETVRRIFEPFFSTRVPGEGTGLGLAVVKVVVERLGGAITVESQPGEGTRFDIRLPRAEGEIPRAPREEPMAIGQGELILVIEDKDLVRRLTRRVLEESGYHVLLASGHEEALALPEAQLSAVDLVLSDVIMPGMVGPELVRLLKGRRPELPAVFVSGYAPADLVAQHEDLKGATLLRKPWARADLLRALQAALSER